MHLVLELLQRLHLVEPAENMALESAELRLRGLLGLGLALVVLVLAALAIGWLYRREQGRLGRARRLLLAGLRVGLVALVLVLLLHPVLVARLQGERLRPVVVLLDNTQSMQQRDRRIHTADHLRAAMARGLVPAAVSLEEAGPLARLSAEQRRDPTRVELVREVLTNSSWRLLERLGERGPVQVLLFDRHLRSAAESGDVLGPLNAEGSTTALADALHELLVRTGSALPTAVVVCSDGLDNASKWSLAEAAEEYRDRGVPLHIYGVGAASGGLLQIRDVSVPGTIFVDDRPDVQDDPVEAVVHWRCRGFRQGSVVLEVALGDQTIRREVPVKEGEDLQERFVFVPRKGKEGTRLFRAVLELPGVADTRDAWQRTVQVKTNRVKVLLVEDVPRREYKFLQPLLDRDRRVVARFYLAQGDPQVAAGRPASDTESMFLARFPEHFPDPEPRDPDRRPYDLLILGDIPPSALGESGLRAVRRFVQEGGGLAVIAGTQHMPGDFASTSLAEVLPVEFRPGTARPQPDLRPPFYRPLLSYEGERSALLSMADRAEESRKLWEHDLWKDGRGFYWFSPVTGLKPGATPLLVHPTRKVLAHPGERPLPLAASHYFGKGEVLFLGFEETWRWRDSTEDRLTARFWGQVVTQLGLPHLLGQSRRVQLALEHSEAMLGQPGSVRARLLGKDYEPLTRPIVGAVLTHRDASDRPSVQRIQLKRIAGLPGEYRATLPHDRPGRFELKVEESEELEPAALAYRVDLPPHHELQPAGLAEQSLRRAAAASGGKFYHEESLPDLPDQVARRTLPWVQRQEIVLWGPLAFGLFVALIALEWVLRKYSNLS